MGISASSCKGSPIKIADILARLEEVEAAVVSQVDTNGDGVVTRQEMEDYVNARKDDLNEALAEVERLRKSYSSLKAKYDKLRRSK